jgi:hypothetical protein
MSESQSVSRSRLELARDEVDRVFGDGHAVTHPELVIAVVTPRPAIGRAAHTRATCCSTVT